MITRSADVGFVGTGAITRAMVEGLSTGPDPAPSIVVSPRGPAISADLAARFANVSVADDNQAVVDAAPVIVLATRPDVTAQVLADLTLAPDQVVISAVAAFPLTTLRAAVAPADRVARSIPLPSVADRRGLVPVVPAVPEAVAFFERLGEVAVLEDETAFDAFSAASAVAAFELDLLATVQDWLAGRGVGEQDARRYVTVLLTGLTDAMNAEPGPFADLADDHATPGGLNAQIRAQLRQDGVHDRLRAALDAVAVRISG